MKKIQPLKDYPVHSDSKQRATFEVAEIYDVYTPKASPSDFSISFEYYVDSGRSYGMDLYPSRRCVNLFVDSEDYWLDNNISLYKSFLYRFESNDQASRDLFQFIQFTVNSVQWCYDCWMQKEGWAHHLFQQIPALLQKFNQISRTESTLKVILLISFHSFYIIPVIFLYLWITSLR